MPIRKAVPSDIPALNNLLEQILLVHHNVRPDIFQESGRKFNDEQLKTLMSQEHTPIFVYENEEGKILGHLFCIIKEPHSLVLTPIKTLFIEDLCVDESARGQKIGEQLCRFAEEFAQEMDCYNLMYGMITLVPYGFMNIKVLNHKKPSWKKFLKNRKSS